MDPSEKNPEWNTTKKVLTGIVFGLGTTSVLAVAAISGRIFWWTAKLSVRNITHLVETKGQVWQPSKVLDLSRELDL